MTDPTAYVVLHTSHGAKYPIPVETVAQAESIRDEFILAKSPESYELHAIKFEACGCLHAFDPSHVMLVSVLPIDAQLASAAFEDSLRSQTIAAIEQRRRGRSATTASPALPPSKDH
jgi:hypothetical protein